MFPLQVGPNSITSDSCENFTSARVRFPVSQTASGCTFLSSGDPVSVSLSTNSSSGNEGIPFVVFSLAQTDRLTVRAAVSGSRNVTLHEVTVNLLVCLDCAGVPSAEPGPILRWSFLCRLSSWPRQPNKAQPEENTTPFLQLDPFIQCPCGSDSSCTPLTLLRELLEKGTPTAARLSPLRHHIQAASKIRVSAPPELHRSPAVPLVLRQHILKPGCLINLPGGAVCRVEEALPRLQAEPTLYRVVPSTAIHMEPIADDLVGPSAELTPAAGGAESLTAGMASLSVCSQTKASAKLAGIDNVLTTLRELIAWPREHAEEASALGVRWPKGVLLHGPSGTGKSASVAAVAEECGAELHTVTAASVFGAFQGESERRLRDAFRKAKESAEQGRTVVVLLDEIDALAPRRARGRQHEGRVVAQLLTLMDGAGGACHSEAGAQGGTGRVLVVGTTNRPNAIDPAMRRPGRLDREVSIPVPSREQREAILRLHSARLPLGGDVDLSLLAGTCHGFTGADLAALCREAALNAVSRGPIDGQRLPVGASDFDLARAKVRPSIARGIEADGGTASWDDIGGLEDVKRRLRQAVEWPLQHAEAFARLGISAPRGVLLHGPPGCCKTTLARAAAASSGATLIPLSGAQLYSMYVGEGESLLRDTFRRARQAAPSIVFLDEIDAVAGKRSDATAGASDGSSVGLRLLSALLTEMDGLELARGVLVLGATNRPAALDAALCRPGRFDAVLYVPPPDEEGRLQTLRIHSRGMPLHGDVDLAALAQLCERFTGAELAAVCREAALAALREESTGLPV
eukprot:CAMPEP_0177586150 /NCGR_PEP_ID=MMETSP0419_2-20121207/4910_1 /TAXON_ID=582737 /ORGANISM="Tetraselmis sp., Strain GSL018" /LENGTH=801 /DNA_ID=CAMNT_0019076005 /DNA_START=150 /DNA_END=2556 /DNA_ORIENTATION=-